MQYVPNGVYSATITYGIRNQFVQRSTDIEVIKEGEVVYLDGRQRQVLAIRLDDFGHLDVLVAPPLRGTSYFLPTWNFFTEEKEKFYAFLVQKWAFLKGHSYLD